MNLALNCWFSQCYNTRILTAKLSPYYFTYLLFSLPFRRKTIIRFIADGKVVYQRVRREMRLAADNNWTRHHLKHFTFELEVTVNYLVHTWTENGSFMRNLTSWSVPFWLVLLTEHEVLHCYMRSNTICRCLVAVQLYRLVDSLQRTVDASKFLTLVGQFTQQPSCTIGLLLWQI